MIATKRHLGNADENKDRLKQLAAFGPIFRDPKKSLCRRMRSKRRENVYRAGRPSWIKVKNRHHPALARVKGAFRTAEGEAEMMRTMVLQFSQFKSHALRR